MATSDCTRSALEIQEKLQETLLELAAIPTQKLEWVQLRERARALDWALGRPRGKLSEDFAVVLKEQIEELLES